jgi:hypothetical protein
MKTPTTLYRTQATPTIAVSTVCTREGRALVYETTLIVDAGGSRHVLDGVRTASKDAAGREHDETVRFVFARVTGCVDSSSARHARWTAALAAVV